MDIITDNIILILLVIGGAISQWWNARIESKKKEIPELEDVATNHEVFPEFVQRQMPEKLPEKLPEVAINRELARQQELAERVKKAKLLKSEKLGKQSVQETKSSTGLKARLNSKEQLRDAFMLKEILDKPVGLR